MPCQGCNTFCHPNFIAFCISLAERYVSEKTAWSEGAKPSLQNQKDLTQSEVSHKFEQLNLLIQVINGNINSTWLNRLARRYVKIPSYAQ